MIQNQAGTTDQLVAVVVTFDRRSQLQTTVTNLLATPEPWLSQLIVVDNASSDGTAEWLALQTDPRLTVLRSDTNLGGAGGFEFGMRIATERFDPDWIVVMDDDARPGPDTLKAFHACDRSTRDVWAAAVHYPDGRICEMNRPSINPFWNLPAFMRTLLGQGRNGYHIPYAAYEGTTTLPVDIASFVGLFVSRAVIRTMGYPEGWLFLYGDDVIYTLNLRRRGFTMDFDPALQFEHDCSTFENDRKRVFSPLWKVYYTYRNGLIMYHRAAGVLFWPLLLLLVPKWLWSARRYEKSKASYLRLTGQAIIDGVLGRKSLSHKEILAITQER